MAEVAWPIPDKGMVALGHDRTSEREEAHWLVLRWGHKGVPAHGHMQAAAWQHDMAGHAMASRAGHGRWVDWQRVSAVVTDVTRGCAHK